MLELQRTLYVLRRWWWLLIAAAIIGGLVAYLVTKALAHPQYQSTATVAIAPEQSSGGMFAVTADAALIPATAKSREVQRMVPQVSLDQLSRNVVGSSSVDGELLFITVTWPDPALAPTLANAVAKTFILQERQRLARRWAIISGIYRQQQQYFRQLMTSVSGGGAAASWLRSQYADSTARLEQQATQDHIQATMQVRSLELAVPAAGSLTVSARPTVNAALGAVLALLLALVFAFFATTSYGQAPVASAPRPVLSKVGE